MDKNYLDHMRRYEFKVQQEKIDSDCVIFSVSITDIRLLQWSEKLNV